MWNAELDESQAGIKIARRNTKNLSCADDITLMTGSKEELKNPLMKVKEESEKAGFKLNIQKMKIMASSPIQVFQSESCSIASGSLWPHGLYSPWTSLGKNTGVGSLSHLQRIFLTQGLNPGLSHCRRILYHWATRETQESWSG